MMRRHATIPTLAAALCLATFPATPLAAQGPQVRAILPGIEGTIMLDTMALTFNIHGNRDSIFTALETVFKELKLPVESRNAKSALLNNLNADVSRRLGDQALSRYLDCGRGFSGSNADFYRITLAISTWVEPASGEPHDGRDAASGRAGRKPKRLFAVHLAWRAGKAHRRAGAGARGPDPLGTAWTSTRGTNASRLANFRMGRNPTPLWCASGPDSGGGVVPAEGYRRNACATQGMR
jgi:hypothetical protein